MLKNPELRRAMIVDRLDEHCKNGDAYLLIGELYQLCLAADPSLEEKVFHENLAALIQSKYLFREGERIYTFSAWHGENTAADFLARLLMQPPLNPVEVPLSIELENGISLSEEQRNAVDMVMNNRISLVLGGPGTGKTTIIQALYQLGYCCSFEKLACAPTGKAVRNLIAHGVVPARTIHSALGMITADDEGCSPITWEGIKMILIDEVSMMTTQLLATLLTKVSDQCRLILFGDDQQLPPIGPGNIIADLCALGIPHMYLRDNHRLNDDAHCLANNVAHFDEMVSFNDLKSGESFEMIPVIDQLLAARTAEEAARKIMLRQDVQVICTHNAIAADINSKIRDIINPQASNKYEIHCRSKVLRDGDRVLITQNDRDRGCYNGDIGTLRIHRVGKDNLSYSIVLSQSRTILWRGEAAVQQLRHLLLAYAITVHRAQGSEYDYVMMPIAPWMHTMLTRNLLFTAISRARQQMLLYGDPSAVDMALAAELPPRRSMLVPKVHALLQDSTSMPDSIPG
ncbi:MAG: AAA family ATPase [Clostridia bacterium]|nr:AAA family ATPase [Clostridia bacterium]